MALKNDTVALFFFFFLDNSRILIIKKNLISAQNFWEIDFKLNSNLQFDFSVFERVEEL